MESEELSRSANKSTESFFISSLELTVNPRSPTLEKSSNGNGSPVRLVNGSNYHSADSDGSKYNEENTHAKPEGLEDYKRKAVVVIEEYFATDDVASTANELINLGWPCYQYYFVKKLVSMAMDRHDREKEMAAVFLSSLYSEVIEPHQVYKGFSKLVESVDDLSIDIPQAVDVLALFIARAVVDDILPPSFLMKQIANLPEDSKGIDVIKRAEKGYLMAPLHAEMILNRWGGSKSVRVEDVRTRIKNLLAEYVVSGDKKEACRCIKDLKLPFFHHEIVKQSLVLAMEKQSSRSLIFDLLKDAAEEGVINMSQMSKGFNRLIEAIDDLSLDIPSARKQLQLVISSAASEGWLCASSLKPLYIQPEKHLEDKATKLFKERATSMIREYFLTGDIWEVLGSLETENINSAGTLNALFVKRLITAAMDRKNREREMASVLLTSLSIPEDDVVNGFILLIESADDTALDIPSVVEVLAMFLARAVVDEVLAPSRLDEIGMRYEGSDSESVGKKVLHMARSMLRARLSGERILRCWGGGGSSRSGWEIEDIKDKINKLLEEYDCGGDVHEACRCIKELGMPFFHHEVIKKALVNIMEKKNDRMWALLKECHSIGLMTPNQMKKGFERVADCMDDLVLDIPDVRQQYDHYVDRAKQEDWLDPSFPNCRSEDATGNDSSS